MGLGTHIVPSNEGGLECLFEYRRTIAVDPDCAKVYGHS